MNSADRKSYNALKRQVTALKKRRIRTRAEDEKIRELTLLLNGMEDDDS